MSISDERKQIELELIDLIGEKASTESHLRWLDKKIEQLRHDLIELGESQNGYVL